VNLDSGVYSYNVSIAPLFYNDVKLDTDVFGDANLDIGVFNDVDLDADVFS